MDNNTTIITEANALDNIFHALNMDDIIITIKDNNLIASDNYGNRWRNEEIYDFIFNDALQLDSNGNLLEGYYVKPDLLKQIKSYAKQHNVKINYVKI